MKRRYYIGILLAAVVSVYSNTLWNGFTMDDTLYIHSNPQVTAPTAQELFTPNKISNVFRPLTFASYALNWSLAHDHPWSFHLLNLLLHAGVTCLLFFLLRRLLASLLHGETAAFAAALLFAVHPIHTEAVASIVGRAELLGAGFLIAAWIFHLQDREVPALLCFVFAVLSKESAVVFLPLVLAGDYAIGCFKPSLRYIRICAVTLLYVGVLWKLQGGRFGIMAITKLDNPLAVIPAGWRTLNALHVAWKYIGLQVFPATLSCDYSFNAIPVYLDLRHTLPWAVAAAGVLVIWCWAARQRRAGLLLAGAIYGFGFAVTSNILMPIGTIMGERLAYFPSIGFCVLIALAWSWLTQRQRRLAWGVLAVVTAALGARAIARNRDWKDNVALYSAAVRAVPDSAKMHANLGTEYLRAGELAPARKELQIALQIEPQFPDAMESYGLLEAWTGNYQFAGQMLEGAYYMSQRNNPDYDNMAMNLVTLYVQTGHSDGALDVLNREIAEAPGYAPAWSARAMIRYKQGDLTAAKADADTALHLDPANPQAKSVLLSLKPPQRPVSASKP